MRYCGQKCSTLLAVSTAELKLYWLPALPVAFSMPAVAETPLLYDALPKSVS